MKVITFTGLEPLTVRAFGALLERLKDSPEARQFLLEMERQSQSQQQDDKPK